MSRPLLLIDGNSLTYRAFFALPTDLTTASGQVTNAVTGFCSMLATLLRNHEPAGVAVAFDLPGDTFRHEREPSYKANRDKQPDILYEQLALVRELVEALTGLRHAHGGTVLLGGDDITNATPRTISERGVAHVPEDREKHGLVGPHSIADNLVLNRYFRSPYARRGIRQAAAVDEEARRLVADFDVRTTSIAAPARSLSGGNKQKVIAARELSQGARLLVAAQPTRGIDVGSIEFVHQQMVAQRDEGVAVLLVSAELDEILSLSDRIGVIFKGRLVAVADAGTLERTAIGRMMTGGADAA